MNKMKKVLIASTLGVTSFALIVGGSIATMQERTDTNQNSSQNRNSNRIIIVNSNTRMSGNMMNSNMEMNSNSSMDMNSNPNMMNSNMDMNSNSNMMNSNMSAMNDNPNALDADFAMMAAMGGMAEIEWAKLAVDKSTNKNVQKFAKRMIKDHTKASKNLMKVASKKNMTLPTTMSAEQMQVMNSLQAASGAEFDRIYIQMSGVDAHQKMAALFQNQVNNGTDAELKEFAAKTLPTVQMHLQMAQEMSGNMMNGGSMNMNSNMNRNMNSNRNRNSNRNMNSNGNSNMNSNSNVNR
jgi:putative membrane protein